MWCEWCEWRDLVDALLVTVSIIAVIAVGISILGDSLIGCGASAIILLICIVIKSHLPDTVDHVKYDVAYKQCKDFLGMTADKYTCSNYASDKSDICKPTNYLIHRRQHDPS